MRVLWPFISLYRRHGWRIALGIILACVTLLASISLLTLSGWFLSASALAGLAGLFSFNYMLPAGGVRGAAIIRTVARYAERLVSHDTTFRILTQLRVFTFTRLLPLSPGGLAQFRHAELLNRLIADVDTLDHLYLRVISPLVGASVVIICVTLGLAWFDPRLALYLGSILLLLLLLFPLFFYHAGKPIGQQLTALRSEYRVKLTTWLQGHAELVIFGAADDYRRELDQTELNWIQQQQQQTRLSALSQSLMILVTGLTLTLILWLAANGVGGQPPDSLIALFAFATLASFEALGPVAGAFQHLGHVIASASRVAHLLQQQPAIHFPAEGGEISTTASLSIDKLSFTYPGQPQAVLQGINLHIDAGQHVALLGSTGCGKSTLLQLITRAWQAQEGEIYLNGSPLSCYAESTLRSMMSVVPQRIHLFSATLRNNLALSSTETSDQDLEEILSAVGLSHLLAGNEGLNTWLGEGGRPLSGGELRRLGIARALLHSAPLLLLDEPTEGLDAETEQSILTLIHQQCRQKTVIIVTHRLQGMEAMDNIFIMDHGLLVETGTHCTLLQQQGHYSYLQQKAYSL